MPQIAAVEADGLSPSSAISILPGGASSEKPIESPQIYTVKAGDTLSGIASRFLGSGARFLDVYEANRDRLPSPDALQVGQELRIPPKNGGASTLAGAESSSPLNESATNPPPAGFERPGKPPWMADKPTELPR
jgi:LysM repeat protein